MIIKKIYFFFTEEKKCYVKFVTAKLWVRWERENFTGITRSNLTGGVGYVKNALILIANACDVLKIIKFCLIVEESV